MSRNHNAYLNNPNRLQDVIAAIQTLGSYKFYKLPFAGWADRISADESRTAYWKQIFDEHPEFFRLDTNKEKCSLVWRRQHPRRYHVDLERNLSQQEYDALEAGEKTNRVSRIPLSSDEIQSLIKTAIELHSRAIQENQDKRWWIPIVTAVGALVGAVIGGLLKR